MMRSILFCIALLWMNIPAFGQMEDPVKWSHEAKKKAPNEYELILTAKIEKGWHIYSQFINDGGPVPTSFKFKPGNYALVGKVQEKGKAEKVHDKGFDMEVIYFSNQVQFVQKVKLTGPVTAINGSYEFMVCNDEMCLPPDEREFTVPVIYEAGVKPTSPTDEKKNIDEGSGSLTPDTQSPGIGLGVNPVKWKYEVKPLGNGEYELKFIAGIDKNWHIYGQEKPKENGPAPTSFSFKENKNVEFLGVVQTVSEVKKEVDSAFGFQVWKHENEAVFVQKIKLKHKVNEVTGTLTYMACDDKQCLPAENVEFSFPMKDAPAMTEETLSDGDNTLMKIFGQGFVGGIAALLTPCVFPMIPLTVSFFTKKNKERAKAVASALLFGVSIIGIYVSLGFLISRIFGPDALNAMSSNVWFNLSFFVIFMVFAISFFGAFEITLPSSWATKADQQAEKGGMVGIFFMAFTLALVSFSCTGPIIGTLLVETFRGGYSGPITGMLGFAVALALPFTLFAAFPSWMQSLPKSGGWLNSVKVTLGFIELALALKFLSVVDLAYHWEFLKREYFLALWIIIFALLGFYLLGKLRFSHDSPLTHISVPRLLFSIMVFSFSAYMVPGLWGAPLNLLSGLAPPLHYSEWNHATANVTTSATEETVTKKYGNLLHCPHGINCFFDYEEGMAYAKEKGKPVMLDFTGHACVNCRKMEEHVWVDPKVLNHIKNDYVLISLYVDDKTSLPEDEIYVSDFSGKEINTIGKKWSDLEASKYGRNTQPFYVLLDHEGKPLNEPSGYNPSVSSYLQFLEGGLAEFKSRSGK